MTDVLDPECADCGKQICVCPPPPEDPADRYDLTASQFLLFDQGNNLENQYYDTFAAAVQGARSRRWRGSRWIIFAPDKQGGGVVRRYDSGEEFEYWRAMDERGSANIGPIPDVK